MSKTSSSAQQQRAATRRALARKAAALKQASASQAGGSDPSGAAVGGETSSTGEDRSGGPRSGPGGTAGRIPTGAAALVLAAPDPAPLAELVLEQARPEVLADVGSRVRRSDHPLDGPPDGPARAGQVETIEVGSRRRSRFASSDGRRLLIGPRLRKVDAQPVRRPDLDPPSRIGRRRSRRRLERRGFVPVTPGRVKMRHRILPRTVIGITTMIMAFGLGVGFSGAAFYAYYDQRLARNEETVARFVDGFDRQFTDAVGVLDTLRTEAVGDIRAELAPLGEYVTDADGVVSLPAKAGPSVWQLETRDEAGRVLTGSAFAVAPHGEQGTALVTSYSLIVAATVSPGPPIELVKGDQRVLAQLWAWDEDHDLALVVTDVTIPPMAVANGGRQLTTVGGRLFAVSGVGGQGATASPGVLLDHSRAGLQHTAAVGTLFQGGPLVDAEGRVIGVATLGYRPFGIDPGQVLQAPDATILCERLLSCAELSDDLLDVDVTADLPAVIVSRSDNVDDDDSETGPGADAGATTAEEEGSVDG